MCGKTGKFAYIFLFFSATTDDVCFVTDKSFPPSPPKKYSRKGFAGRNATLLRKANDIFF